MLMYFTLRGVLASLLVLRATAYWKKVPDLEQLQMCSRRLADALEEQAGLDQSALEPVPRNFRAITDATAASMAIAELQIAHRVHLVETPSRCRDRRLVEEIGLVLRLAGYLMHDV